jgi:hypothetical protein
MVLLVRYQMATIDARSDRRPAVVHELTSVESQCDRADVT